MVEWTVDHLFKIVWRVFSNSLVGWIIQQVNSTGSFP